MKMLKDVTFFFFFFFYKLTEEYYLLIPNYANKKIETFWLGDFCLIDGIDRFVSVEDKIIIKLLLLYKIITQLFPK